MENPELDKATHNQSDTDDWTLVSSPHSSNSSLEQVERPSNDQAVLTVSAESSQHEDEEDSDSNRTSSESCNESCNETDDRDDGMTEINLNDENERKLPNKHVRFVVQQRINRHKKSTSKQRLVQTDITTIKQSNDSLSQQLGQSTPTESGSLIKSQKTLKSKPLGNIKERIFAICRDWQVELDRHFMGPNHAHSEVNAQLTQIASFILVVLFLTLCIFLPYLFLMDTINPKRLSELESYEHRKAEGVRNSKHQGPPLVDVDPSSHIYLQLKMLDSELAECIREKNPTFHDIDLVAESELLHKTKIPSKGNSYIDHKPYRGLVCYDNESYWRKKFDRLKYEYDLDMRRVLRQARKRLTSNMLETYHPSLRFKLILNQLEYLDYLEQYRKDRLIEKLKAENLELLQRFNNQPKEVGQKGKSFSSLESENAKLKRENEALKANLAERAGTVYIRQSHELERCERENNALKQFHYQVSQDVTKELRLLDMHTIGVAEILTNQQENLDSQLALTKRNLLRLIGETHNLAKRNKGLEDDLNEIQLLTAVATRQDYVEDVGVKQNEDTQLQRRASFFKSDNESQTIDGSCSNNNYQQDYQNDRSNWLMRRARIRERLRKDPDLDIIERHLTHLIEKSKIINNQENTSSSPDEQHYQQHKYGLNSDKVNKRGVDWRRKSGYSCHKSSKRHNQQKQLRCKHKIRDEL